MKSLSKITTLTKKPFQKNLNAFFSSFNRKTKLKDFDKFNRLPEYKLEQATNVNEANEILGSDNFNNIKFQFNQRTKTFNKDKVEIAKHILRIQKENLLKKSENAFRAGSVLEGAKLTQNLILNKRLFKEGASHPELKSNNNNDAELNHFKQREFVSSIDNEYGNYSKYFSVSKQELEVPRNEEEFKKMNDISPKKKLETLKSKYSTAPKDAKLLQLRDKKMAEMMEQDLKSVSNRDVQLSNFLKRAYSEVNRSESWNDFLSKVTDNLDKAKSIDDYANHPLLVNLVGQAFEPHISQYWHKNKKKPAPPLVDRDIVDNKFDHPNSRNKTRVDQIIKVETERLEEDEVRKVLSLTAQDELYNLYLDGYALKDLALKYGVLPWTVKRIICNRYVYWNFIYPKIGPITHREMMEKAISSGKYQFFDYGAEINDVVVHDQFIQPQDIQLLESKHPYYGYDMMEPGYFINYQERLRKKFIIPLKYIGKMRTGFLVYNVYNRRGKNKYDVSNVFKDFCNFAKTKSGKLKDNVLARSYLGPRLACVKNGY